MFSGQSPTPAHWLARPSKSVCARDSSNNQIASILSKSHKSSLTVHFAQSWQLPNAENFEYTISHYRRQLKKTSISTGKLNLIVNDNTPFLGVYNQSSKQNRASSATLFGWASNVARRVGYKMAWRAISLVWTSQKTGGRGDKVGQRVKTRITVRVQSSRDNK